MKKRAKNKGRPRGWRLFLILLPAVVLLLPFPSLSHSFFRVLGLSLVGVVLFGLLAALPDTLRKARESLMGRGRHTLAEWMTRVALLGGLLLNLSYAGFRFFVGVAGDVLWFCIEAVYYLLLSAARIFLVEEDRRAARENHPVRQDVIEWQTYRRSGWFLLLLSLAASSVVALVLREERTHRYPDFVVIGAVVFTAWRALSALFHLLRFRRRQRPILSAAKLLSFSAALLSLFTLQSTLLARYGGDFKYRSALNSVTGVGVCVALLAMGVLAIRRARQELKKQPHP